MLLGFSTVLISYSVIFLSVIMTTEGL